MKSDEAINICPVFSLHNSRGCREFNDNGKSVSNVLLFHPNNIEAISGIKTSLKVIIQAQIQIVANCKDNGVHQMLIYSVCALCRPLLPFEMLMNRSVLRMTMSVSLA